MINCKNVPQKVIFTISNFLATKKQQKQQKQHLLLKVSFFVKIEKCDFLRKIAFFRIGSPLTAAFVIEETF